MKPLEKASADFAYSKSELKGFKSGEDCCSLFPHTPSQPIVLSQDFGLKNQHRNSELQ